MSPRPLQLFIIALPITLFGYLAWQELVPTGTFDISWKPGQSSAFVDPMRPDQRVESPAGGAQKILGDPAYTFIHPHRAFDRVDMTVRFRNEGVPIVEAGGLIKTGPDEVYALQSLENKRIDDSPWERMDDGHWVLLQRRHVYESIADFFTRPPVGSKLAAYHVEESLPMGTRRLLPALDLDAAKVDFVIAAYQTPKRDGDWFVATLPLDPNALLMERGAWKVAFSVPGAGKNGAVFVLGGIDIVFHRANLFQTFRNAFHL